MSSWELGSPSWPGTTRKVKKIHKHYFLNYLLNHSLAEGTSCLPDKEKLGGGKNTRPRGPAAPPALGRVSEEEFSCLFYHHGASAAPRAALLASPWGRCFEKGPGAHRSIAVCSSSSIQQPPSRNQSETFFFFFKKKNFLGIIFI